MEGGGAEVVAAAFDALNARDMEAARRLTHDAAELRPALTAGGELERVVYSGRDAIARYAADLDSDLADARIEVMTLRRLEDGRIFMHGHAHARGRASGVAVDVPVWALWELREGKIYRGTGFRSEEAALGAAEESG